MEYKKITAEQVVMDVMRHFGFRRNYQVAKYFNVTPQTLSGWIKSGEIPPKHLIKYNTEISNAQHKDKIDPTLNTNTSSKNKNHNNIRDYSFSNIKKILKNNYKILLALPSIIILSTILYVFWIASPLYVSTSKVLPVSEDGSSSNGFSGVAAQLGINIPLSIGGTVPWAEIYPEIVKSGALLSEMMNETYETKKYGSSTLMQIIINENSLSKYSLPERKNRAIIELRKMIKIKKDRISPIVTLEVGAFEPLFVSQLSGRLIDKSGQVQRQLKTNRVSKKKLFIEERLQEVSTDLNKMEKELREFREYNRNISSSPSLQMKVQEMGREIDLQNSLYVTLKTQYEKAKIDEVERDDMVQIIDGPNLPAKLTSPRRGLSILLSLFFSIFSCIIIIYFRENNNI
jgi:capsule polysaccharide export protein KpsE/RkpR